MDNLLLRSCHVPTQRTLLHKTAHIPSRFEISRLAEPITLLDSSSLLLPIETHSLFLQSHRQHLIQPSPSKQGLLHIGHFIAASRRSSSGRELLPYQLIPNRSPE